MRQTSFARGAYAVAVFGAFVMGGSSSCALAESASTQEDRVILELATMGKRGAIIARTREYVITILQDQGGCSEWFQDANPDAREVFRSLHYEIVEHENPNTLHLHNE